MKTRHAIPSDLLDVWRLCWKAKKELQSITPETVDPELLMDWIEEAMGQAPCVLLVKDGVTIGFWGLCTCRARWSHDVILADYMFYVLPEHRSMKAVEHLKTAVQAVADQLGLNLQLSYLFTDKKDAHIRLFEKVGFEVHGVMGVYRGNKNGR